MIKFGKASLIFVLLILASACDFLSEEQVKNDFQIKHSTYKPIPAVVNEGNSDTGYYHIRYKKSDDDKIHEQIWFYLRQNDGKFKVANIEKEIVFC